MLALTVASVALILIKSAQAVAGHEKPGSLFDFVLFLFLPVNVRWSTPHRPSLRQAVRCFALGIAQVLIFRRLALPLAATSNSLVMIGSTQVGLYVVLAGWSNVACALLSLRGLDYDPLFRNPLLSRTPAEFWGRRWNTWISRMLHRYVFLPVGGRRHPVRASLLVFAVSGIYHEAGALLFAGRVTGWFMIYFLLQGVLVTGTSRSKAFRHLSHRMPVLSTALTLALISASGAIFVRSINAVLGR